MANLLSKRTKASIHGNGKTFQGELQETLTKLNEMIDFCDEMLLQRTNEERHSYKSDELTKQINMIAFDISDLRDLLEKEKDTMDESEYKNSQSMIVNLESMISDIRRKVSDGREVPMTKNSGHFGIEKTYTGNILTGVLLFGMDYFFYVCVKKK